MRKPDRVYLLDELRGLAVLLMIFYHGAYDAVYLFRFTGTAWFTSAPMAFLQRYIAVSFILIAGIMGRYTGSNLRRGTKTFLCGMLVTAVTLLVLPSERILFGILHFLGAAMMLLGLCEPLLKKIPAPVGLLLSALLYLATDSIGRGWIGLGPLRLELPRALYDAGAAPTDLRLGGLLSAAALAVPVPDRLLAGGGLLPPADAGLLLPGTPAGAELGGAACPADLSGTSACGVRCTVDD